MNQPDSAERAAFSQTDAPDRAARDQFVNAAATYTEEANGLRDSQPFRPRLFGVAPGNPGKQAWVVAHPTRHVDRPACVEKKKNFFWTLRDRDDVCRLSGGSRRASTASSTGSSIPATPSPVLSGYALDEATPDHFSLVVIVYWGRLPPPLLPDRPLPRQLRPRHAAGGASNALFRSRFLFCHSPFPERPHFEPARLVILASARR